MISIRHERLDRNAPDNVGGIKPVTSTLLAIALLTDGVRLRFSESSIPGLVNMRALLTSESMQLAGCRNERHRDSPHPLGAIATMVHHGGHLNAWSAIPSTYDWET